MFERFTQSAREVIIAAQEEARTLPHDYIGSEHILLGVARVEESSGGGVLAAAGVRRERVRAEVLRLVGPGTPSTGQIPFTPRAKRVLELALRASLHRGHGYIGAHHLLLGILDEGEGVAVRVLLTLGVDENQLRSAISSRLERESDARRDRYLPYELARRAVEIAAEAATSAGRRVDPGDLIVALAEVDSVAREALTRYVSLADLVAALDDARRAGESTSASD